MDIIKQPDFLSLNQNTNYLIIKPSQINTNTSNISKTYIRFNDNCFNNQYVLFDGVQIIMSDVIDDTDKFITLDDRIFFSALQVTIKSFISTFNTNPILNKKYYAKESDLVGWDVLIESLYEGSKFNLNLTTDINSYLSFNPQHLVNEYENENYNGYKYKIELWESQQNYPNITSPITNEKKIYELVKNVVDKEETYFDINEGITVDYLFFYFNTFSFQKPKRYYIKIKEQVLNDYNIDIESFLEDSNYFYVLQGAKNHLEYLTLDLERYINTPVVSVVKLLTELRVKKTHWRTNFDQKEFLGFYYTNIFIEGESHNLATQIRVKFKDNTQSIYIKNQIPYADENNNGKYIVDVSPSYLGLENIEQTEGKEILFYYVSFVAISTISGVYEITEEVKYEIIESCEENKVLICFLNSLGSWETFMFSGANDKNINLVQETFETVLTPELNQYQHQIKIKQNQITNQQTLNSRYLKKNELEWLKEMVKSPYLYEIKDNDEIKPLVLNSFDYVYDNQNDIYTLNVSVSDSYVDNSLKN